MGITVHRYTLKTAGASRLRYTFSDGSHTTPDGVIEGPPGVSLTTLRGGLMLKVPRPGNPLESDVFAAADAREEAIKQGSRLRYEGVPVPAPPVAEAVVDMPVRVTRGRRGG